MDTSPPIQSINQIYSLRVNQIDAKVLDSELYSSVESHLNHIPVQGFKAVTPELLALVKAYIWFYTTHRKQTSIGQSLLELKYYDLSRSGDIRDRLTRWQSFSICLSQVLIPWIKQRVVSVTGNEKLKNRLEAMENIYNAIDFFNRFIFLFDGKYRSLCERLFRIGIGRQSLTQSAVNSELYIETMNRELLWHTFAEFLAFVMPLINFYRLRNTFNILLRTKIFDRKQEIASNVNQRNYNDLKVCVICQEWPIDGHEIGCRHVFCYYCLMSNFLSDPSNGFTCDLCFYKIDSIDSIKRIKAFIS